jgi:large subunit ribosomal protein L2
MSLKKYKPITPSLRNRVSLDFKASNIFTNKPIKSLTSGKHNKAGRGFKGRISSFHRGGGHKRLNRVIDLKRNIRDEKGYVVRIEYDPNRSSYIALIAFTSGSFCYILAPDGLQAGTSIIASSNTETPINVGNSLPLRNIPVGTFIHNVEMYPDRGGQIARSAGCYAKIIRKDEDSCLIRLTSGKQIVLSNSCFCTIGFVSNQSHSNIVLGKAGRSRWLNKKPTVRGVVMNPVDHPHGGGEGKTSGGRCSVTPWGIPTKGYRTNRKKKKNTN